MAMTTMLRKRFLIMGLVPLLAASAFGQGKYFSDWPAGSDPRDVGKLLANNWLKRDFEYQSGKRPFVIYPEACSWYGALNIARLVGDQALESGLVGKFDRFLTPDGASHLSPQAHVD